MRTKRMSCRGALLGLLFQLTAIGCVGCDNGPNQEWDPTKVDIYKGLRSASLGEILCDNDSCCLKDCWGRQDRMCATRIPEYIISKVLYMPADECTTLAFPEWFYAYDCFVETEGVRGDTGADYGQDILRYEADDVSIVMNIRCFCGRSGNSYASSVGRSMYMRYFADTCKVEYNNPPSYELSAGILSSWEGCANPCQTCTPRCNGRECGPDGCGGVCGTCSGGITCSAAGTCISDQKDSCSACLSVCSGLMGCCTGCGCMCEDECGGCW